MSEKIDDAITAGCEALQIPLDPAWLPAVRFNYETSLRLGLLVAAFELPDETDPASVFAA